MVVMAPAYRHQEEIGWRHHDRKLRSPAALLLAYDNEATYLPVSDTLCFCRCAPKYTWGLVASKLSQRHIPKGLWILQMKCLRGLLQSQLVSSHRSRACRRSSNNFQSFPVLFKGTSINKRYSLCFTQSSTFWVDMEIFVC